MFFEYNLDFFRKGFVMRLDQANERLHHVADQIYRNLHSPVFVPPVQSLMDVDFYKFTMGQMIHRYYGDTETRFRLTVRDRDINVWRHIDESELAQAFEYVTSLRMRRTDLYYLRGMDVYGSNMFSEEYLAHLAVLALPPPIITHADGVRDLTFEGLWKDVSHWETIGMAILSELYYRSFLKELSEQELHDLLVRMDFRLKQDLFEIKKSPAIHFADFGQRRRFGYLWHEYVVGECKRILGDQFTGTSDTYLAFKYDLVPIGTNAHELPMVVTALAEGDDAKRAAQYEILREWESIYGQGLRIILPDTFGSEQFFANAPNWLTSWRGQRQDSGDPTVEAQRYMDWLTANGADPKGKVTIFSDGLDVTAMKGLSFKFDDKHITPFGWGTLLTNNCGGLLFDKSRAGFVSDFRPFSMVVKVSAARRPDGAWQPCVKLSNNIAKATGPRESVAEYVRIFGDPGSYNKEARV